MVTITIAITATALVDCMYAYITLNYFMHLQNAFILVSSKTEHSCNEYGRSFINETGLRHHTINRQKIWKFSKQ